MKQILAYFLVALFLNACGSSMPTKSQSQLNNLSFIDTEIFDKNLLKSMSVDTETITVAMIGDVSVNHIPERLGKWLSTVDNRNGHVSFEAKTSSQQGQVDDERTTDAVSVGLVLGVLPTAYGFLKEEYVASLVEKYNAILVYDPKNGC